MEWMYRKKINLKHLLLHSLNCDQAIEGSKFLTFKEKKSYNIRYKIDGKYLVIQDIKQIGQNQSFKNCIKKRFGVSKRPKSKIPKTKNVSKTVQTRATSTCDKCSQTSIVIAKTPKPNHQSVQTIPTVNCEKFTQTPTIVRLSRSMQTDIEEEPIKIPVEFVEQDTQTDFKIKARSTQTEAKKMANAKLQVTPNAESCGFQTELSVRSRKTQTDIRLDDMEHDLERAEALNDAVVYLLGHLGETVIDQRNILNNNSERLDEILEQIQNGKVNFAGGGVQSQTTLVNIAPQTTVHCQPNATQWYSSMNIYKSNPNISNTADAECPAFYQSEPAERLHNNSNPQCSYFPLPNVPGLKSLEISNDVASTIQSGRHDKSTQTARRRKRFLWF